MSILFVRDPTIAEKCCLETTMPRSWDSTEVLELQHVAIAADEEAERLLLKIPPATEILTAMRLDRLVLLLKELFTAPRSNE